MTATPPPKRTTAADAYRILCEQMGKRGKEATDKVQALAQTKHGTSLEAYHESAATEDDKFAFYREALTAILRPEELAKAAALKGKNAQDLFKELCELVRQKGREAHLKVTAHLRAVTGEKTAALAVYHNGKAPEPEKIALYVECIVALKSGDYSRLKGSVGAGDKRVDPVEEATAAAQEPFTPEPPPHMEGNPDSLYSATLTGLRVSTGAGKVNAKSQPEADSAEPTSTGQGDDLAAAIIRAVAPHIKAKADLDEKRVRQIAGELVAESEAEFDARLKKALGNGAFPVERVKAIVSEMASGLSTRIEFRAADGSFKPLPGLMHPQVPQIAAWLRAVGCCWAWGSAGSGKTHMARQIAAMLEVEPYVFSVDPTITVSKIMGYRNVANGEFVPGFAYQPYKTGGLLSADEMDTGDPGVMACGNALLSNTHYMFANGETVERNPKFCFLALANTKGMGAVAGYTARNRLDAATLDRFPIIEVKYDPGLELALACGDGKPGQPWKPGEPASLEQQKTYVEWVQKVREYSGNSVLVSPRASINGCKALRVGIPMKEVVDALVLKLVADDSRKRIEDHCGLPY